LRRATIAAVDQSVSGIPGAVGVGRLMSLILATANTNQNAPDQSGTILIVGPALVRPQYAGDLSACRDVYKLPAGAPKQGQRRHFLNS